MSYTKHFIEQKHQEWLEKPYQDDYDWDNDMSEEEMQKQSDYDDYVLGMEYERYECEREERLIEEYYGR